MYLGSNRKLQRGLLCHFKEHNPYKQHLLGISLLLTFTELAHIAPTSTTTSTTSTHDSLSILLKPCSIMAAASALHFTQGVVSVPYTKGLDSSFSDLSTWVAQRVPNDVNEALHMDIEDGWRVLGHLLQN